MKIQNRITLLFTALTAGIIIAFCIFIYTFSKENIEESFFHRLEVRADIVGHASLDENKSKETIYHDIKEKHLGDLPEEEHYVLRAGEVARINQLRKQWSLPHSFYDNIIRKEPARYINQDTTYVGLSIADQGKNVIIVSKAVDLYGLEELHHLKSLLTIGFLIALVFVFTFGRLFSYQVFNPIRRIIRNVKGISAHNLHQRLAEVDARDEIGALSNTFNEMLNRLEITFEMQNNFVSNASHEFRTPLTVISGEAELGLSEKGISEEVKASFQVIFRESEKLEHLTATMLSLAQTGFDGKREQWEKIRLDELILFVKGAIDQIHPENAVGIDFDSLPADESKLEINGNAALLRAAFTNIVLNSCKYSDYQPVTIKIGFERNDIVVEVVDRGIGIPESEMGQIFVPFFRASNTKRFHGYGIGLPLANNIIKMHQGSISVRSIVGVGTRFIVFLPLSQS